MLTQSVLQAYTKQIPMQSLPATLKDAIQATRELGFSYLWIDALCIIQDSDEDKSKELALMADIYKNAIITIGAAKGDHSDAGLFAPREPHPIYKFDQKVELKGRIFAARDMTAFVRDDKPDFGPLSSRAWTLQEELLSTRILTYGSHFLTWDCATAWASDRDPLGDRDNVMYDQYKSFRAWLHDSKFRPGQITKLEHAADNGEIPSESDDSTELEEDGSFRWRGIRWDQWYAALKNYTQRNISRLEDKLPAISALARSMYEQHTHSYLLGLLKKHRGTYVAGLWREDLQYGLNWFVTGNFDTRKDEVEYLAPSWSWASVPAGHIRFHEELRNHMKLSIIDVFCRPVVPRNPFGKVNSGSLIVRAPCKPAVIKTTPPGAYGIWMGKYAIEEAARLHTVYDAEYGQQVGACSLDHNIPFDGELDVLCLLTFVDSGLHDRRSACCDVDASTGLALMPTGKADNEYHRVGILQMTLPAWYPDWETYSSKFSEDFMRIINII